MFSRNVEPEEVVVCDACSRIPLSHLSLDISEPLEGWERTLPERGIEIALDDLGRASVPRRVLGELLAEQREREARLAAQRAEQTAQRKAPVSAGVPALEDASPYESMVAAGGVVTPQQEFGRGRPVFQELLDAELAEGQKAATGRAERKARKAPKEVQR